VATGPAGKARGPGIVILFSIITLGTDNILLMPADRGRRTRSLQMRDPGGMPESGTTLSPRLSDPQLDGDHERMSHIVLEGFKPEEGDFVSAGPSVVEGMVNGTAVRALCGKIWVPGRDPKRYGICPTCKEIAEGKGWKVPGG
jgi:hypothetical protein